MCPEINEAPVVPQEKDRLKSKVYRGEQRPVVAQGLPPAYPMHEGDSTMRGPAGVRGPAPPAGEIGAAWQTANDRVEQWRQDRAAHAGAGWSADTMDSMQYAATFVAPPAVIHTGILLGGPNAGQRRNRDGTPTIEVADNRLMPLVPIALDGLGGLTSTIPTITVYELAEASGGTQRFTFYKVQGMRDTELLQELLNGYNPRR